MRRTFVIAGIITSLIACADSTAPNSPEDREFAIIATKTDYTVGQTVSLQLFNRSEKPLGYGACALTLEFYGGDRWVDVGPKYGACIAIMYVLNAAGTRTLQFQLGSGLSTGTYRLRMQVFPETHLPTRFIYSPTFRLRA